METEKWVCLDYILKLNREVSLREYLSLISELEKEARAYYTEEINMDSREFLQMLLLDSCFILVYLGSMQAQGTSIVGEQLKENIIDERKKETANLSHMDAVYCQSVSGHEAVDIELNQIGKETNSHNQGNHSGTVEWYNSSAVYDLLLMENQIPFFIFKMIYQFFSRNVATTSLLTNNISEFMEGILYHFPKVISEVNRPEDFYHLLHLCHKYLKPSHKLDNDHYRYDSTPHRFHFIFEICRKIFTFGREQNMFHELGWLDSVQQVNRGRRAVDYHEAGMQFKKREFDDDNPHSLLDIRFRKGIIVHQMESDEDVSTLFTKLFEYVAFDFDGEHYLKSVCCAMEAHYQSRINRWMAWLWHNHFSNPWVGFAAIASAFVVLCSIMQTVLAFLSYMG